MPEWNIFGVAERRREPPSRERRDGRRYPLNQEVMCHPMSVRPDELWWETAMARDISGHGIGLVLFHPVQPGLLLNVTLTGKTVLLAHVIHTLSRAEGGWFVGCAFANPLGDQDLQAVLTQATYLGDYYVGTPIAQDARIRSLGEPGAS
ncbi:MAG: PilZ domain-containing protein [Gemmataceae bacterium]|nr:PilZ domain-containing protein [Gemmataceae bacterium]